MTFKFPSEASCQILGQVDVQTLSVLLGRAMRCCGHWMPASTARVSKLFMAKGHARYCGLVAGRAWLNNNNWYTKPLKLLCNSTYIIYKYSLAPHGTTWRATRPVRRGLETHGVQRLEGMGCIRITEWGRPYRIWVTTQRILTPPSTSPTHRVPKPC
jgi:hypothetical protein